MSHCLTRMSAMEHPTKCFHFIVGWIQYTRNMAHSDVSLTLPFLYSKVLYIDMTRTSGRLAVINHIDDSFIVFIDDHSTRRFEVQISWYRMEVLYSFGSIDSCDKLGFRWTGHNCGLHLCFISYSGTTIYDDVTAYWLPCVRISSLCSICKWN